MPEAPEERSGELCDRDDHADQHEHDDRDLRPDQEWRHGKTAYPDGLGEYLRDLRILGVPPTIL
jgi:hypothetical protein